MTDTRGHRRALIARAAHARASRRASRFDVRQRRARTRRATSPRSRQGGLGLPDRDYYFLDDERTQAACARPIATHLARVLKLNGDDDAAGRARNAADASSRIETELARASMTAVERRDLEKTYNKMTLARAGADRRPASPGAAYFDALRRAAASRDVNVRAAGVLRRASRSSSPSARSTSGAPTCAGTCCKDARRQARPRAIETRHFDFYEQRAERREGRRRRAAAACSSIISGHYGTEPHGARRSGSSTWSARSRPRPRRARSTLVQQREGRARATGCGTRRLDEPRRPRRRALEKLAAMTVKIGYPDRWRDFSAADVGALPLRATTGCARNSSSTAAQLARLGKPVDRERVVHVAAHRERVLQPARSTRSSSRPASCSRRSSIREGRRRGQLRRHRHGDRPRDHPRLRRPRPPVRRATATCATGGRRRTRAATRSAPRRSRRSTAPTPASTASR